MRDEKLERAIDHLISIVEVTRERSGAPQPVTIYPESFDLLTGTLTQLRGYYEREVQRVEHLRSIAAAGAAAGAAKGGSSTSERKREASRANIAKARAARRQKPNSSGQSKGSPL